jgi:hypothetical protein
MANTPQEWWRDIPIVTKVLLTSTFLSTVVTTLGLTSYINFALIWPLIFQNFQIWRLFGCLIYAGGFSFPYLMHMLMLYQNSAQYELEPYNTGAYGTSADYLWLLCFATICLYLLSFIFQLYYLSESIMFVIVYVNSRRHANDIASFFGLKFKTLYVPWINVGLRLLMGYSILSPLLGIGIGHLYYYLVEIMPSFGYSIIHTPQFCSTLVEYASGRSVPVRVQPIRPNPTAPPENRGGYNWGTGRTLGNRDN